MLSRTFATGGLALALLALACSHTDRNSTGPTAPAVGGGNAGQGPIIDVTNPTGGAAGTATNGPTCADDQTSVGCDFYSVRPPTWLPQEPREDTSPDPRGGCFAAFIVNVAATPVSIQVEYRGTPLDTAKLAYIPRGQGAALHYEALPGGVLPPREVAILFLTHRQGAPLRCPFDVGLDAESEPDPPNGSGTSHAFHITTSAPVAAYDIFPYGGGRSAITSATLLLPTRAWGDNYVGVSAYKPDWPEMPSSLQLLAKEDGTEITVLPSADIRPGAGVPAGNAGQIQTYRLNRGELVQLAGAEATELVGSTVSANKPIGVWGASACFTIDGPACDSAHQQIPPIRALGHEYVAVRYKNRFPTQIEFPPWRIVGAANGTILTYDPAPPKGAPTTLDAGQMVEFKSAGPFKVSSQDAEHPFYLASYMFGCGSQALHPGFEEWECRGDPEFVNVIPPAQYMRNYVFFTDPTYPETSLVVVRQKGAQGFDDVTLDCAGTLGEWKPIGAAGQYEYTYFTLVSGNFEPQANCDNGRHELTSNGPVGLTVWGWGNGSTGDITSATYSQAVSYAYPAGASVQVINDVVIKPPR